MRLSRRTRLAGVAMLAAASLTMAACGGGSDTKSSGSDSVITVNGSEPQNPLVPTATNEVGGGNVVDVLFSGLVAYKADGASVNEVAESITSDDNSLWTVKIKDGQVFSDGSKVTSKSFVDAWNYGALSTNAQLNSYFFYPIKGFDAVQAEKPKAKTLSGLKVVDDSTFTIALNQPEADFPARLGYSAFFPLPESALGDVKAYGENPVGNGPYKLAKKGAWKHKVQIALVPNDKYTGIRKPKNGGVTFKLYTNVDSAYTDVQSGNLDILKDLPASALSTFQKDDTVQPFSKPGSAFASFTIPAKFKHFGNDKEGNLRRQALSKAINRKEITDKIFFGTRTPAVDFSSPTLPGFDDNIAGSDVLKFDATAAKKLWADADAINKWDGKFQLAYNADSPNKEWVDAIANQIKNNLGIVAEGKAFPTFDELRTDVTNRTIKTPFRTGWQPDYPSIYNYLAPIYGTKAGSNDGDYSSPAFDGLMKQAAGAKTPEERYGLYTKAQEVLFKDLPAIPLWYTNVAAVAAKGVKGVSFDWQNLPELHLATK